MDQIKQWLDIFAVLYYIRDRKQETDRKVIFVWVSTRFTLSASFLVYKCSFFTYVLCYWPLSVPSYFFHGSTALVGLRLLTVEVSRSQSDTPQSVGLLWTRDQPVAETSTWQHKTFTETDIHAVGGIRTRDSIQRAAADPRLRPRGQRNRPQFQLPLDASKRHISLCVVKKWKL